MWKLLWITLFLWPLSGAASNVDKATMVSQLTQEQLDRINSTAMSRTRPEETTPTYRPNDLWRCYLDEARN